MAQTFDMINGFRVRPGVYELNGATPVEGAVNFTVTSTQATYCELVLFRRGAMEPYAVLPFPEHYRIGHVFSMRVYGLDIEEFEYSYRMDGPYCPERGLIFDRSRYLLDPYAKAVVGQSQWGTKQDAWTSYKARVVRHNFDWGTQERPNLSMEELIIYELHVRGFTKDPSSGVEAPGTFAGLKEKIPYLKDLGINAVELMPIFEFDECKGHKREDGEELLDYWGYNTVCFFAPNTSYANAIEYNREGRELKDMIQEFHKNGIEVILDVVFNHTAEGNEHGPFFSFKGLDNNVYYMLTPDGYYYNFSGCGNTLNCNHPVVQDMILSCLRYWTIHYRVDGFRFDLASILGRNEDGSPMRQPPLLKNLAFDPILGKVKLIAEAWDAGGMYQVGNFPSWNRWAEWNGKYRDDMRSFLKGDGGKLAVAALRMMGSPDLYDPETRGRDASVNFLNCHDGFTLYDLYAYNVKHNEENGWKNSDGDNNNLSWNCGEEGETDHEEVKALRLRMMKNACVALMMSRGTPMFFSGDEFANTQYGNNNAYCQDNPIAWVNWNRRSEYQNYHEFYRYMIHFRKQNPVIYQNQKSSIIGIPPISAHKANPWEPDQSGDERGLGILYAGRLENGSEDIVYVFLNVGWEETTIRLPALARGCWQLILDTTYEESLMEEKGIYLTNGDYLLKPRSTIVCKAVVLEE
ncbi:MAG: alpha-amylase family glycosyl hydrolase [Hespellia sp.]|nr:alpha-amylase family glycosyl hydrolase [Hespellia sp.]